MAMSQEELETLDQEARASSVFTGYDREYTAAMRRLEPLKSEGAIGGALAQFISEIAPEQVELVRELKEFEERLQTLINESWPEQRLEELYATLQAHRRELIRDR